MAHLWNLDYLGDDYCKGSSVGSRERWRFDPEEEKRKGCPLYNSPKCESKPISCQVQLIDNGTIQFNGLKYSISSISTDQYSVEFQSHSLRKMTLTVDIYGRLVADFWIYGSRMLEMKLLNGRLLGIEPVSG